MLKSAIRIINAAIDATSSITLVLISAQTMTAVATYARKDAEALCVDSVATSDSLLLTSFLEESLGAIDGFYQVKKFLKS